MAQVTTQTFADRRVIINRIQEMVLELHRVNNRAEKVAVEMIASGADDTTDVKSAVDIVLAAGGPLMDVADGTTALNEAGDTAGLVGNITNAIVNMLNGEVDPMGATIDRIGWEYIVA